MIWKINKKGESYEITKNQDDIKYHTKAINHIGVSFDDNWVSFLFFIYLYVSYQSTLIRLSVPLKIKLVEFSIFSLEK